MSRLGLRMFVLGIVLVLTGTSVLPTAATAASPRPCRAGSIVLTFDDGPSPKLTPRLVRILLADKVPATFFMVGNKVRTAPATARFVQRSGFTIGNHTWSHRELTRLPSPQVRRQVLLGAAALRGAGIDTGTLMRPPYGAIDARVRGQISATGLVPVLWTADSRDWVGGSATQIAHRVLLQLRPGEKNIVLQHDGVENSAASIAAVPIIIRVARSRGYCFTDLDDRGDVGPVKSAYARAIDRAVAERARQNRKLPSASASRPAPAALPGEPATQSAPTPGEERTAQPSAVSSPLAVLVARTPAAGPLRAWVLRPPWAALVSRPY